MNSRQKICILIAASSLATRNALKMYLNEQPGLYVVDEAKDGHELLKRIESTGPDVVLLDWDLLDRATPILIKTMCAHEQELTIITLSAESDHQQIALDAGADAFINLGDSPRVLLTVIDELIQAKESDENSDL